MLEPVAALLALLTAGGGDAGGGPVTPAALLQRTYLGEIDLAPDGRHGCVFESSGAGDEVRLVELEWGLRGATRREHALPGGSFSRLTFGARGEAALFLRGGPPDSEVWRLPAGGEPQRLLPPGVAGGIFALFAAPLAPDGAERWLALTNSESGAREAVLRALDPARGELGEEIARFGRLSVRESVLSPDRGRLALIGTDAPTYSAEDEPLDLWLFDFGSKGLRRVTAGGRMLARPVFTPDSKAVVCTLKDAGSALALGRRELARIDVESGAIVRLTENLAVSIGNGTYGADEPLTFVAPRTLLVATQHGLADDILEVTLPEGAEPAAWRWRTDGGGSWSRLSAAVAARRVLAIESGPAQPERVALLDWPSLESRVVENPNAELAARPLATGRVLRFEGADRLPLEGLLLEPKHGKPPFPTIVLLHGGSDGRSTLRFNDNFGQAWAGLGYAVFEPNLRGSDGYGVVFSELNRGDFGGRELLDLDRAADALVADGVADPHRLFVAGHSYGGYLAEMAAVRSKKFRAACAAAGVSDWKSFAESSDLAALAQIGLGGLPGSAPDRYRDRSPLQIVAADPDAQVAPLLMIHGQRDRRVPVDQSERFFALLQHRSLPAELIALPGVGHVLRGRENVEHWLSAADTFFRSHGDLPPPGGNEPASGR
jgi:acetyl esterase/lipase